MCERAKILDSGASAPGEGDPDRPTMILHGAESLGLPVAHSKLSLCLVLWLRLDPNQAATALLSEILETIEASSCYPTSCRTSPVLIMISDMK